MRRSRFSRRLFVLALQGTAAWLAGATPARAQAPPQVDFLLLPVGARAAAIGQAAAAEAGSSEAIFWNPAGLAGLRRGEFGFHHYESFFGPGDALVLAFPSPSLGTFGLGLYVVDYGDFDITPPAPPGGPPPNPIGVASVRNVALSASYAAQIGALAAGLGYKLVQFRVDCSGDCTGLPPAVGTTHSVDVGLQLDAAAGRVRIGVMVRNLGFKLQVNNQAQADPLPTRLQAGVRWRVLAPPDTAGFDLSLLADLRSGVRAGGQPGSAAPLLLLGIDAGLREVIRLRGGYAFLDSEARGPSLGIGLTYASFALDLARVFFTSDVLNEEEPVHVSLRLFF
jgi:hypothetical protein